MTDTKNQSSGEEKDSEQDGDLAATKTGPAPLVLVAAALVAALGAGAGAFFLTPQPASPQSAQSDSADDASKSDNKHGKPKKTKKHAKKKDSSHKGSKKEDGGDGNTSTLTNINIVDVGDKAFVEFAPLIISLPPAARSRHLKIRIVIETAPEDAEAIRYHAFTLNDVLNTYLRSVDSERLHNPVFVSDLKEQIELRVNLVAPDVDIHNTLITEFLLT